MSTNGPAEMTQSITLPHEEDDNEDDTQLDVDVRTPDFFASEFPISFFVACSIGLRTVSKPQRFGGTR